jgi:hypothetical protein
VETLIVERDWQSAYNQTTTLRNKEGKVVSVIREHIKQPKKGSKTIVLTKLGKQVKYLLDWSKIK